MAETPSSIRLFSLEEKFQTLLIRLAGEHADNSAKLDSILQQTTLTNGTVRDHTKEIGVLKSWKDKIMGAWLLLTPMCCVGAYLWGKFGAK